jgi:hypothetical protein
MLHQDTVRLIFVKTISPPTTHDASVNIVPILDFANVSFNKGIQAISLQQYGPTVRPIQLFHDDRFKFHLEP